MQINITCLRLYFILSPVRCSNYNFKVMWIFYLLVCMYIFSHLQAVLRMKSSPLTPQEIVRIQEVIRQPHPSAILIGNCSRMLSINLNPQGLKYFKYDWMSVWKFIVPYRDPSSLSRQWRTALGIQKSYKLDAVKNEKRRLYETKRKSREQLTSAREVCLPVATSQIIEPNSDMCAEACTFFHSSVPPHTWYNTRCLKSTDKYAAISFS